jgi:carbon storage regulator CsrA
LAQQLLCLATVIAFHTGKMEVARPEYEGGAACPWTGAGVGNHRFKRENVMLILTRKPGETLRIGESITIQVVGTSGQRVKLGINAPEDMVILRGELRRWNDEPKETPQQRKARSSRQTVATEIVLDVGWTSPVPVAEGAE